MNNRYKKGRRPRVVKRGATKSKLSKPLRKAIKQVINKEMETKTINVPQTPGGSANTVAQSITALSGVNYLAQDLFRMPQGPQDGTAFSSGNRIGDKVKAVGFLMDYYLHTRNYYSIGTAVFFVPWVKVRVTVFRQAFGSPLLSQPLLYDTNFLNTNTSTLQPVNWNEGYVKDILYDKVHIIRNNLSTQGQGGPTSFTVSQQGQVYHLKKYIKFDQLIKYTDNNTTSPNSTEKPIYIALSAEVDDAQTGLVPSGTQLLSVTGYTRCWFKDV